MVDVWIDSTTSIDQDVFGLWVQGLTVEQATLCRRDVGDTPRQVVTQDTQDQFMLFNTLEPYLQSPLLLAQQCLFVLSAEERNALIQRYYEIAHNLFRELLGKSLSSRTKKDLDECSEKCGLPLLACRRQFDNVRRVYKAIEYRKGKVMNNIKQEFLLDDEHARLYGQLMFAFFNKLSIDNRKLDAIPLADFLFCVQQMIDFWTGADDLDLEKSFLQDLRELKYAVGNKEVLASLRKLVSERFEPAAQPRIASALKLMDRNLFNLGAGLSHSKELRDVFEDIIELLVVPCQHSGLSAQEVDSLFQALQDSFVQLSLAPDVQSHFEPVFVRFIQGLRPAVVRFFSRLA